jgi:hypothetical protein
VPRFYLSRFAKRSRGKKGAPGLYAVQLSTKKRVRQLGISDATVGTNFYTVEELDDPVAFEKFLAKIEEDAAPVLKNICELRTWPLALKERQSLARLITFQYLRGQGERDDMSQMATSLTRVLFDSLGVEGFKKKYEEARGETITNETAEELYAILGDEDSFQVKATAAGHVQVIMGTFEEAFSYFVAATWVLIRFRSGSLLTSDSPVNLVPRPEHPQYSGLGLQNAFLYVFPLSREVGLMIINHDDMELKRQSLDGSLDRVTDPSSALAKLFNTATISNAYDWLYAHPDDARLIPEDDKLPIRPRAAFQVNPGAGH